MNEFRRRHAVDLGTTPRALGLSTASVILLRDLIRQKTGQFFDDRKLDLLADRAAQLVVAEGTASFLDYYYLLKYDPGADEYWGRLLDVLAVPETYFWRQFDQVVTLRDVIVPERFATRPLAPLTIWSAACCSGEEPLTIAMALADAGWLQRMRIDIVGTDASPALVEEARSGVYRQRSMRAIPTDVRDRYFTEVEGGWRIDPALHRRVRFAVANLADEAQIQRLAMADITFCRNVFIYFDDASVEHVAAVMARHMPHDGYLFLGASESLLRLNTPFHLVELGDSFAYRLSDQPARHAGAAEPRFPRRLRGQRETHG